MEHQATPPQIQDGDAAVQIEPNQILDGYLSAKETAGQINKSERTLARWRDLGTGPAYTLVGQSPFYRISAVRDWLRAREVQPVRGEAA